MTAAFLEAYGPLETNIIPEYEEMCHSCVVKQKDAAFVTDPGRATFSMNNTHLNIGRKFERN